MHMQYDILVLGATGFTGRLVTRYLAAHPQRDAFTLAIGARSPAKLQALVRALDLPDTVRLVTINVAVPADVDRAVIPARVVINTVGPYWLLGTPVVRSCARHGVHYVDLTGETVWYKDVITKFDYLATKTGAIIVPSCGMDSMPSDISAFLSNKCLKKHSPSQNIATSTTSHGLSGGISGGTASTMMMVLEDVPRDILRTSEREYSLSPVLGLRPPRPQLLYELAVPYGPPIVGTFFLMQPPNKKVVQRTFGLLERQALDEECKTPGPALQKTAIQLARYGPRFTYDEFAYTGNKVTALLMGTLLMVGVVLLNYIPLLRLFIKQWLPQPGEGPSDENLQRGALVSINLTQSESTPPVYVETRIRGKGDPGYLLTSIMISEAALCLLVRFASGGEYASNPIAMLPPMAQTGGVLTPMTAFGDVLVRRLEETGRFEFDSKIVDQGTAAQRQKRED